MLSIGENIVITVGEGQINLLNELFGSVCTVDL